MRKIVFLAVVAVITLLASGAAMAQADKRFAVRFGLIVLEPTADSVIQGERSELKQAFGVEGDFEWYFLRRVGLEGSILTGVDADVEDDGDTVAGVTVTPLTVGINFHPIRTPRVDWSIGAVAGVISYGDFEFEDDTSSVKTDQESTYGVQTAVDIGVAGQGRWGINVGLKYLKADLELDEGALPDAELAVDPLILRVMGVFRF
jgi:outer membrane protein W